MKNLSLVINSVLALAVAVLYYFHFSQKTVIADVPLVSSDTAAAVVLPLAQPTDIKPTKIVFVNADSLLEKYEYLKDLKKETEAKHSKLEAQYNAKAQKFQEDYVAYQQKATQGTITQDQAKNTEEDLMKRKKELDEMEQQLNLLIEETQKKNAVAQKNVTEFLKEYNKNTNYNYVLAYTSNGGSVLFAKDSLDITRDVLNGLNARYKHKN